MRYDNEGYPDLDYRNDPPVDWFKILWHLFLLGLWVTTLWVLATGCKGSKYNKPKYSYGQSKTEVSRAVDAKG